MAYKEISPIPVVEGGTSAQTITLHGVILGQGTSAVTAVSPFATAGVPLISNGAAADPIYGTAVVEGGGTGVVSFDAYAVICGGTTSTGVLQDVAVIGTLNQVLTSNGAGQLPTFQDPISDPTLVYVGIAFIDSPYIALAGDQFIAVDTTGGAVSVLLPDAPATGKYYIVKDAVGNAATANITVTTVSGIINVDASPTFIFNTNYEAAEFLFDGTNYKVF